MKKLLLAVAVLVSSMTFVATEVEAKRMGGGGSFGKQSQSFQWHSSLFIGKLRIS